jgi:hypothetical protein
MEGQDIARIIDTEWKHGVTMFASGDWEAEVAGIFDHDWNFHLLLREWHIGSDEQVKIYSLWFLGPEGVCLVKSWQTNSWTPPFVEAATLVEDWRNLVTVKAA